MSMVSFKFIDTFFGDGNQQEQSASRAIIFTRKCNWALQASSLFSIEVLVVLAMIVGAGSARGQEEHKHKVPGVNKLTSGISRGAFSGDVASLDLKQGILQVHSVKSENVEFFPIKKGIQVSSASGARLQLNSLKPGNNVIIYYDQKGDRRTVKQIVVLAATTDNKKKKSPPAS